MAEDHTLMRDNVVRILKSEFQVLDAVADGEALLEAAARLKPDVCVLDISMPEVSGIETATRLKQSGSTAKVIFLTIHDDFDFIGAALKTGADGYVFKTRMAIDLLLAVHEVLAGRTFLSPLSSRN
ncbi:MAG TPA: response regulator transcription factor [Pyrinomonadaceae bacterium]